MRRIVFSIAFVRKRLPVQLIFTSTKSRQNFYAQIQLQSFHTAWDPFRKFDERARDPHS
jgi:hypothetical protein